VYAVQSPHASQQPGDRQSLIAGSSLVIANQQPGDNIFLTCKIMMICWL
jgi:hypothetical protein